MKQGYTTIEQSRKLIELGLDPSTADMFYATEFGTIIAEPPYEVEGHEPCIPFTPAWSLTALLELMPYFITIKEEGEPDEYYHFQLNRNGSVFRSKWQASYHGLKTERGKVHTRRIHWEVGPNGESETPLDAAFETVCWLIEQGHIKVNK
jgi:hypothetical protein